jgi:hypothetical protein
MESKVVLPIIIFILIIIIWFSNIINLLIMDQKGDFITIKKMDLIMDEFFNVDENFKSIMIKNQNWNW